MATTPAPVVHAGRVVLRGWRYLYGENPLHLVVMIGCFALTGYVVSFVYPEPSAVALAIWFGGAVIGHDLVLYPLYALADQPLTVSRWARRKILPRYPAAVPVINHIRVPALGAGLLGLIFFPSITGRGDESFAFTAAMPVVGRYDNWLLITGVLFLGSAVIYALRLGVAGGRGLFGLVRRRSGETPDGSASDDTVPGGETLTATVSANPETASSAHDKAAGRDGEVVGGPEGEADEHDPAAHDPAAHDLGEPRPEALGERSS